mmetsp:Transcript_18039/g.32933  ORF Transcript_18039/g.32933 Transcript_18039/m.32933 type:complete len:137 (-) Transcript_18039:125-535(-)|eukprot:CAMPEP_0175072042 /NCGR_PEP_ID=MMETSP0052_2-20121109/19644_1 /TAXON_ID=51329 ORGANISM="Polytomella parva, Strain SAG 63-3" /NCGR_SAMPLE_ID=MMETSP0052_2 /ASSEMBLY_ACC=CAM_ASM_000194 /LENGTH=136 /DNA_ID=CAMNT_0016339411 /DNA_START=35 /DNA_END=445 /DNA_ORIENTATION=+
MSSTKDSSTSEKNSDKASEDVKSNLEDFIPAKLFTGARKGYYFSLGEKGLGYYIDIAMKGITTPDKKQTSKPLILKANNSLVKGLLKRPAESVSSSSKSKKNKGDEDEKPKYLQELERHRASSCSSDTKHDRPLVK